MHIAIFNIFFDRYCYCYCNCSEHYCQCLGLYTYKFGSLKVEEYSTKTFGCSLISNAETICSNSIWIFYCKFPCMYSISKWKKKYFQIFTFSPFLDHYVFFPWHIYFIWEESWFKIDYVFICQKRHMQSHFISVMSFGKFWLKKKW